MTLYKLSKDYTQLFKFLLEGNKVAAYVDYSFRNNKKIHRDICQVHRKEAYSISIGVRGISYGEIFTFDKIEGEEEYLFILECKRINLEWISP